ncbi:MAG: hypothetical protein AAGI12_16020 [Pseudomonadota bacterium]
MLSTMFEPLGWLWSLLSTLWTLGFFGGAIALYILSWMSRLPFTWPVSSLLMAACVGFAVWPMADGQGDRRATAREQAEQRLAIDAAREDLRKIKNAQIAAEQANRDELARKLAAITRTLQQRDEKLAVLEASAGRETQEAIAQAREKWAASQAKPKPEVVFRTPVTLQCTEEKPDETLTCPLPVQCKPALLQRADPRILRQYQ